MEKHEEVNHQQYVGSRGGGKGVLVYSYMYVCLHAYTTLEGCGKGCDPKDLWRTPPLASDAYVHNTVLTS